MTLDDLKQQRRWVLWRLEMVRNTRGELVPTKVPYQRSGAHASSTDRCTWCSHAEAQAAVGSYTGVGVMMGNGLGCTDLDHCVVDGKILPWAREIIISLDSYSEFSPSGTGVHILGEDIALPGKGRKRPYETGAVEVYDTARFLTFTGRWLPKTPAEILSRRSQFNSLYERIDHTNGQPSGKKDFGLLQSGEWEKAGFPSQSEAVFAFCQLLAEKYHNHRERIDAAFRESGLFSGKWADGKWDRLGPDTIEKCLTPAEVTIGRKEWTLERFSSIRREEIDWIFPSYVAKGKITGLSGEPGASKSVVTLDWAARYSTGRGWPDGTQAIQPPGKVLIFATEDGAADTILPRFVTAGGNPDNLLRLRLEGDDGFYFDNPAHMDILRTVTEQNPDIGMVIIDPILEHILADKEQMVRKAYAPLRTLIEQRGAALIQVVHTNKRTAQNLGSVGDKVGGVKALVGLPRFVYSVHKTDDDVRHLCPVKQNVGAVITRSMDFTLADVDGHPRVEWIGEGSASAGDALTLTAPKTRGGCVDDLRTLLTREWQESAGVKGKLLSIGYGLATISRAAAQLTLTGEMQQDKRGRLTFWRTVPLLTRA
jgi:AAA domain/NrS-1  polymerase HBD domain